MKFSKKWGQIALIRNRDRLRYYLGLLPHTVATELYRANRPSPRDDCKSTAEEIAIQYRKSAEEALSQFLTTSDTLTFPHSKQPSVSVIIVVYNNAPITLRCLQSLEMALPIDAELILVNNGSTDQTASLFSRCTNSRIITNQRNLGFLKAVNAAADSAQGEFLLLLNNDTLVTSSAITNALNTIKTEQGCGAVGGKLVHFDGRLQEAGGRILHSGICEARGRGENYLSSRFTSRWDADYCSGAFLLTSRKLFIELGGFNQIYGQGYYEDVDFCVRVRKYGLRVIYEPKSVIYHLEYGSAESTESAIGKMENNRQHFIALHGESLNKINLSSRNPQQRNRILIVDDHLPDPWRGCGFPRLGQLIQSIRKHGFDCTIAVTNHRTPHPSEPQREWPMEKYDVLDACDNNALLQYLRVHGSELRAIIACRPNNLARMLQLRKRDSKLFKNIELIYDSEAIFSDRDSRARSVLRKQIIPTWSPRAEFKLARNADQVWAICQKEKEVFESHGVKNVCIVSDSAQPSLTANNFANRRGLLFVGSLHAYPIPNTDGLLWFLSEIYPRVTKILGEEIPLKIIGDIRAEELFGLDRGAIEFVGTVNNLDKWFNQTRLFVAPVRYCAGIPRKCIDAASYGVPMVTTDLQANQLGWRNGQELLCSPIDSPDIFAENCATLYKSESTWELIRNTAYHQVSKQFSIEQLELSVANSLRISN